MRYLFSAFFSSLLLISACAQAPKKEKKNNNKTAVKEIITGAESTSLYLPLLKGKNIAIVANQTSTIGDTHLVDFLHKQPSIQVLKVFAPEHGFRGKADAGETIKDGIDTKTGLPIISLYGKNKKPSPSQLENIDIVVFDIQDVGARFYTYISTLHYVMEACAEANIPIIVLDRPNPNAHYVDGPLLDKEHKSFVGMHPVPVVYGMTIGEYGNMINGEKWLQNNINCDLTVIKLQNYNRNTPYSIPIKPSPNLPNDIAVYLYPSLCFFEGTNVSAGRGTSKQFQIYGSPFLNKSEFSFTPKPNEGAKYPKHNGKICYGEDLSSTKKVAQIHLKWLINAYQQTSDKTTFFNSFFNKLAGTTKLQEQIKNGFSEQEIKASWKEDLNKFKKIRDKYLLYK